ncbi:MAG: BolA family transcriptional regulator [Albidovulum sp.]|nr:BolA family transcriptional regulator [Albidovulum sp.]
MGVADEIQEKLARAFSPESLEVIDESESHRGHSGWRDGGETHFRIIIEAEELMKLGRIERHRAIHKALSPEPMARIHALAITVKQG